MSRKKVRLTDNDPLESKTDGVVSSLTTAQQSGKSGSYKVEKSNSQQDDKSIKTVQLKKATYKLSEDVIQRLERTYLQMSLDRGKQDTPYKEVLVETAITYFLDQLEQNPDLLEHALIRQQNRG